VSKKAMKQESVRFKCTVIDDEHPGGVPLERWGQQPAQFDPSAGTQVSKVWWDGDKLMTKPIPLESIYKEPEQPAQQEPYCYVYTENGEEFFAPPTGYFPDDATPLYKSQQLAQRKPLTDEQIDSFREANSEGRGAGRRFSFKGFARAIEAAHGIKGDT
jgi:hypothetical protein